MIKFPFSDYNKFDLPFNLRTNIIDIGIDITDVLRINDKVGDVKKEREREINGSDFFKCILEIS